MITKQLLQEKFEYKDGNLIYKIKTSRKVNVGDVAGSFGAYGYIVVGINGKGYQASRLVWIYHNGDIPEDLQVDHINNIKTDNRIENLRLATASQNKCNIAKRKHNKSGHKGVSYYINYNKWRAQINRTHLGYFATRELAGEAYKTAADKLHGEFAKY